MAPSVDLTSMHTLSFQLVEPTVGDPDVPSCLPNLFCSRTKQGSETSLSSWFSIPNAAVNEAGGLREQGDKKQGSDTHLFIFIDSFCMSSALPAALIIRR